MSGRDSISKVPLRKLRPAPSLQPRPAMVAKTVKKTRAKNACLPCQQSKKKCNEERPRCGACRESNLECTYSSERARHRRAAIRNKIKEYEAEIEKYELVLEYIRTSSVLALRRVLNVIQSQAPLEDIILFIRNNESPYLPIEVISPEPATSDPSPLMNEQWESLQSQAGFLNTELIYDRPILNLSAAPWTTVMTDDELVSHLMSLSMTWDHPVWHLFDFDIFINAMKHEDQTYCLPLYVKTMLAEAFDDSQSPGKSKAPQGPQTKAEKKFEFVKGIIIWAAFDLQWPYTMLPPTIPLPCLKLAIPYNYFIPPGKEPPPYSIQHDLETGPIRDMDIITEWYLYRYIRDHEPNLIRIAFQLHTMLHLILYEVAEKQCKNLNDEKSLTVADKKRFYGLFDHWKKTLTEDL
ncbi:hypothetical protein Dda_7422 [Drechslerella dactyloides]|uniref:Zn(2)-C6 fungal-type domain-containing protein n=1 Tax=Drechslerella dactyloides TaxID=74499 RepID=A0AAD6NGP7_DREDA|nr:hypothetical protein Dda_7422 [Drechslerella dactyloides]